MQLKYNINTEPYMLIYKLAVTELNEKNREFEQNLDCANQLQTNSCLIPQLKNQSFKICYITAIHQQYIIYIHISN